MISSIVSRLVILVFGTLYPAYASYKAVRTKNVKEYVKWMMYWIVFALFTCAETFTDVFLSFWFPFYYEIKIILVLWLLSPATKGSSILYRKFVHPMLSRREQDIDEYIAKAKEQGYHTVLHLGTKGVNYATTVIMQTAIKGGGGLVQQLRRSYSLSDLSTDKDMADVNRNSKALSNIPDDDMDEADDGSMDPRLLRPRGYSPRRSASGSGRVEMYFPEVDVDVRQHGSRQREPSIPLSHIRSSEDVSSGYSSAEPLYAGHHPVKAEGLVASREPLVRTASVGSTRSMRPKSSRGGVVSKRAPAAEDSEPWHDEEAEFQIQEEYLYNVSSSLPSQLASIPLSEQSLTQTELLLLLQQLRAVSSTTTNSCTIIPTDKPKTLKSTVNDTQIVASESESVGKVDGSEPLINVTNGSDSFVDVVGDSELYIDADTNISTGMSQGISEPEITPEVQATLVNEDTFVDADLEVAISLQKSVENTIQLLKAESDSDIFSECSTSVSATSDSTLLADSDKVEDNLVAEEDSCSEALVVIPLMSAESVAYSDDSANITEDISDSLNEKLPENKELEGCNQSLKSEIPSVSNESLVMPLCSQQTIVSTQLETPVVLDESFATYSLPQQAIESTQSEISAVLNESLLSSPLPQQTVESTQSEKSTGLGESLLTSSLPQQVIEPMQLGTPDVLNDSLVISPLPQQVIESMQSETSVILDESLVTSSFPQQANESMVSETAERKDARSGRYHKRPAPTPPDKLKNSAENENPDLDASDSASYRKEAVDPEDFLKPQTAVKARLVLQPGIVKSVGPETSGKSQKFISSSPKAKKKEPSHSKVKQRGSAISRFLVMPKNQLGHFASFLPFWHSRDTQARSAESVSSVDSNTEDCSKPGSDSTSRPPIPPFRVRTVPMSSCSLEYLPYVGNNSEYDSSDISRERSNSISDFKIREMSHSPPSGRRQEHFPK